MKKKRQSYRIRFYGVPPVIVSATCEAQAWHMARGIAEKPKNNWKIASVGRVVW